MGFLSKKHLSLGNTLAAASSVLHDLTFVDFDAVYFEHVLELKIAFPLIV